MLKRSKSVLIGFSCLSSRGTTGGAEYRIEEMVRITIGIRTQQINMVKILHFLFLPVDFILTFMVLNPLQDAKPMDPHQMAFTAPPGLLVMDKQLITSFSLYHNVKVAVLPAYYFPKSSTLRYWYG
jgi:hypothetical protein